MDSIVSVRFSFNENPSQVFKQPLFYLAENIKQYIHLSLNNKNKYNKDKHDSDLNIVCNGINLQILSHHKNYSNEETIFNFMLDTLDNKILFNYKDNEFILETINKHNKVLTKNICDPTIFSEYYIKFESQNIIIFEDFMKTCKLYYEKYSYDDNDKTDKIQIYINNNEESYFMFLGNREKRLLETVYLPKKQKDTLINDLNKFFKEETKKRYKSLGINYKRTYLFEGVPGSGKTSFIIALASHFDATVCIITFGPKFTDNHFLTIMRNMIEVTEKKNKKTFLIIEDIDCIFKERKSHDEQRTNITFSGLLNGLDGIATQENFICFITTNYKCNLDSALLRPGRIDYIMKFDYANKEQVTDIYKNFTGCNDKSQLETFYTELCDLNIKVTTSLLQQYLMKYIDQPELAIKQLHEIKEMYNSCTVNKEAEETGLFS